MEYRNILNNKIAYAARYRDTANKSRVDDTDFLVYVNAQTGKEENILVIIDTPDGILTQ